MLANEIIKENLMDLERQSRLPEYVGKKIVEALKQDENEVKILDDNNETINFTQPTRNNMETTFEPQIDLTGSKVSSFL